MRDAGIQAVRNYTRPRRPAVRSRGKYRKLVVNGRFLAVKTTGVQRVAQQLLIQLQKHEQELNGIFPEGATLCVPSNVAATGHEKRLHLDAGSKLSGQVWEQLELPCRASGDLLLNLCNMAPVLSKNAITMIHDAQIYTMPSSYSRSFRRWYRMLLPIIGHRNLQILTVSTYSARQLAEFHVAPADRITVIHNGVDHVRGFESDPSVNQTHGLVRHGYVVALASVQHHKNIAVLLRAFEGGGWGSVRLVLIGGTSPEEFSAQGLTLPVGTLLAGRVTDGQMRALLEDALCFAMPSLTEGFGLPPLEAMMLGCPALLAPCGALPEICGEAALYIKPHDVGAWSDAVRRLRDDPKFREHLVDAGRLRSEQFTWDAAGRRLIETLRRFASLQNM